ncbi:NAD-dependent epimerase/dehydratase family protein [Macrococcus armenti]|uniref:NAD-dependent epimerase/dehydratase family protein n=1 Tax=Macrococcus armenti TaxID=2875764 RepID=UPI001CD29245|nr:NAD(P)-dependent oxidoreductase [Macrococcus armenti]UBH11657.1 NAD(P)-dependent oxidoreductase [Macrococcus armenti]
MNIIITGATGLLGRYVNEVIGEQYNLILLSRQKNEDTIYTDYSIDSLKKIMSENNISTVVHLAGSRIQANSLLDYNNEQKMLSNIFEASNETNIKKVIIASSISVYSDVEKLPWNETQVHTPKSFYGINKMTTEKVSELYGHKYNIDVINLRLSHLYGANEKNNYMINIFMRKAFKGLEIEVHNECIVKREFLYAKDAAYAILCAINSDVSGTFNIVGKEILSNLEVAEKIIIGMNSNSLVVRYNENVVDNILPSYMDGKLALDVLKFEPKYTFIESINEIKTEMEKLENVPEIY